MPDEVARIIDSSTPVGPKPMEPVSSPERWHGHVSVACLRPSCRLPISICTVFREMATRSKSVRITRTSCQMEPTIVVELIGAMERTSYICSNYTQYETGSQSQSTKRNALRECFWSYWCQEHRVLVRSKVNHPDRAQPAGLSYRSSARCCRGHCRDPSGRRDGRRGSRRACVTRVGRCKSGR